MNDNLEKRVTNLEQLHIWDATAIVLVIVGYFILKNGKR